MSSADVLQSQNDLNAGGDSFIPLQNSMNISSLGDAFSPGETEFRERTSWPRRSAPTHVVTPTGFLELPSQMYPTQSFHSMMPSTGPSNASFESHYHKN